MKDKLDQFLAPMRREGLTSLQQLYHLFETHVARETGIHGLKLRDTYSRKQLREDLMRRGIEVSHTRNRWCARISP
jgi:hypothetical protein